MADLQRVGQTALELIEDLEHRDDVDDYEVGAVLLVLELKDDEGSMLLTRCTEDRAWVKLGLLEAASIGERAALEPEEQD